MFKRRSGSKEQVAAQSRVAIYRGSDSYYLLSPARTTAGAWLNGDAHPTRTTINSSELALGNQVLDLLAISAPTVAHPAKSDFAAQQMASLNWIQQQANTSRIAMVAVDRQGDRITVTPMRPAGSPGEYAEVSAHADQLVSPTGHVLGAAVIAAFEHA